MNVQNKVIVITGGAGGIGSAQAKLLARNGAEVWILDLVQEKIDQLVEELKRQGGKAHGAVADVTSEEEWKTIVERIVSESGRLDVVVNNAGINIRKPIEEMMKDEWMKMMEVNTASVFLATKYVLPVMRKQGGRRGEGGTAGDRGVSPGAPEVSGPGGAYPQGRAAGRPSGYR